MYSHRDTKLVATSTCHVSQLDEGEAELNGDGVRGVENRPATVVVIVQQTTQQAMLVWQRLVVMVTIRTIIPF